MKSTKNIESDLKQSSPKENLNQSLIGCAPCLNETLKIDKKVNGRSLNEIKINEIKTIVQSIFEDSKDVPK